ncbi:MAG: protein kinase [Anaerolineales bacterium]|nr:protein kinase [Anaerolineales bacterium]
MIKSEIGRGGMSIVYHAHDPRTDRDVALKVLPPEFLHDPNFRERFEREARTIAALEHPAIVPIYDFGEDEGQPFIVMRFMAGGSLTDRLQMGPLSMEEVAAITRRIGSALDYAHQQGIVHRDLKPGNILFDRFGDTYLADFGIVQLAESSSKVTGEKAFVGTPAYMSPEQVHGDVELDNRSDMYALGILLFEMLTGQVPYHADTPVRLMMKHVMDPVPNLRKVNPLVPKEAEAIIIRALAKDRDARYQDGASLANDVDALLLGEMKPSTIEFGRRQWMTLLGILTACLTITCIISWLYYAGLAADVIAGEGGWEELLGSGLGKGLAWGAGGLLLAGAALAFTLWRRRKLVQQIPETPPEPKPKKRKRGVVYRPRLARIPLIIGMIGSILLFALAINSCVPTISRQCASLPPDEGTPLICELFSGD